MRRFNALIIKNNDTIQAVIKITAQLIDEASLREIKSATEPTMYFNSFFSINTPQSFSLCI